MQKILFPTDYSPASNAALRYAVALAGQSQAGLLAVFVEPPSVPPLGPIEVTEGRIDEEEASFKQLLDSLVSDSGQNVAHEVRRLRGDPAAEIVRVAKQEGADLIVMATHGRTGLRRALMGSVAEIVVRDAPCPVLTLKEPQQT
ncbi:MAG: universal stress protein [Planctomycetota bacterium]|nr:MAG: universal stress protein [Planctomycetota bacterium]